MMLIVGSPRILKGGGLKSLKNCKRVGVHIFPLRRVD